MKNKTKKVAFCFSGQARTFDLCYPYIKKNILDPAGENKKDYDIFCCLQDDGENYDINALKPTKVLKVTKKELDKNYEDIIKLNFKKYQTEMIFNNYLNQLNNIYLANELRKEYEKKENTSYELVFRIRFDILPLNKMDYSKLNKKFLYLPHNILFDPNNPLSPKNYNDMLAIGTGKFVDIYSNQINEFGATLNSFFSEKFKFPLRTSLFFEKKWFSICTILSNKTKKGSLLSKFFMKLRGFRNAIFLKVPPENYFVPEDALFRYLNKKHVECDFLDLDYALVREELSRSILLLNKRP